MTPENKIAGRLSFDPAAGGHLELLGAFAYSRTEDSDQRYELIHGAVLIKGRGQYKVTLWDCDIEWGEGNAETHLRVKVILWTSHFWFDDSEDIQFEKIVVNYTYLDDWMRKGNFKSHLEHFDGQRKFKKDVRYLSRAPTEIPVGNVIIEVDSALQSKESPNEVSLKELNRFIIRSQKKLHFEEFVQYIDNQLPTFLTLATGQANYALSVEGQVSSDLGVKRVYIYYQMLGYTKRKRALRRQELLFSFRDVHEGLPNAPITLDK